MAIYLGFVTYYGYCYNWLADPYKASGKKMVLGMFWAVAAFLYISIKKLQYVILEKGTK